MIFSVKGAVRSGDVTVRDRIPRPFYLLCYYFEVT